MSCSWICRYICVVGLLSWMMGCASVQSSGIYKRIKTGRNETPLATLQVTNTGWFLFDFIPLASGNPKRPNENTCLPFQDTVTLQNNLDILLHEMKRRGTSRFENLSSRWTNEKFLFLLITRHGYHTSAILLDDEKDKK